MSALCCAGVNLRSGRQGIFPSAYAVDMDYSDFDPATPKVKRERYLLGYLGSVETKWHKVGDEVFEINTYCEHLGIRMVNSTNFEDT